MQTAILGSLVLFSIALFALLAIFVLYPLYLYLYSLFKRFPRIPDQPCINPRISLIVVVHNAASSIERKVRNCLALDYPEDRLDIYICSDGSTDQTEDLIIPFVSERIHLLVYPKHRGKALVINEMAVQCAGELLAFSDADAILSPDSLNLMARHFSDDAIGGVSGLKVIREKSDSPLLEPQQKYYLADSIVKKLESRIGSETSNDGTLYIIRRRLFRPISPAATDDLFACLNIVSQGSRFIFEPHARAYMEKPSQTMSHEILRRRRIVCRSLHGIWLMRALLNPIKFKSFAVGLFINKVLRRALPLFLIIFLVSSVVLAFHYPFVWLLVGVQMLFYLLAVVQLVVTRLHAGLPPVINRVSALALYFCLGNVGTFWGVLDFVRGKRYEKWEPARIRYPG